MTQIGTRLRIPAPSHGRWFDRLKPSPGHSHDVFISHAGEDKETVARPLYEALKQRGWSAWLDELEMTVGDSLSTRIDEALRRTRFGVVILSPKFFAKKWPQRELQGLTAKEVQHGTKVILPVWHKLGAEQIAEYSPTLADRVGVSTSLGIEEVADQLSRALAVADKDRPLAEKRPLVQAMPVPHAPRTGPRRKPPRRRFFLGGQVLGVLLLVAVLSALASSLVSDSSGSDEFRSLQIGAARFAAPSASRNTVVRAKDRQRGLTRAIRDKRGTILLGLVARKRLPIPASGISSFNVQMPAGVALRSEAVPSMEADRIFTFRLRDKYLMVVCRSDGQGAKRNFVRDCDQVARSVYLPQRSTRMPYPPSLLQSQVNRAITRYRKGRDDARSTIAAAILPSESGDAAQTAAGAASSAAQQLTSSKLAELRDALHQAQVAWNSAARAAAADKRTAYSRAGQGVKQAEQAIDVALQRLVKLGYA